MIRVDGRLEGLEPKALATAARAQEQAGYDGTWTSETSHDPFLPLVVAAEHTTKLRVGCAIAVMFARNPMSMAYVAHDMQALSCGRFVLGLGTQVQPHIQRRFSMEWGRPVDRAREFIAAVRTILGSWQDGIPLDFDGEFYSHTLMTPFFAPENHGYGIPKIFLAVVGTRMAEMAGEVADGIFTHSFTTPRYLREALIPSVMRGVNKGGRSLSDVELNCRAFVATGETDAAIDSAVGAVRAQLAFSASTPAYRPVLELHGWAELGEELHHLSASSREDKWQAMAGLIDDEVLSEFAVVGPPEAIAGEVIERFGGVVDRFRFYTPYEIDATVLSNIAHDIQTLQSGRSHERQSV